MGEDTARETREITVAGRTVKVLQPNTEQIAVMVRMGFWGRNYGAAASPGDGDHYRRQLAAINRVFTLTAALFADQEEWDRVEDEMAAGRMPGEDAVGILVDIARVWGQDEPVNRAERRAKKTGKAARVTA